MITIEQMVQREVLCCMSSLVSTLAKQGYGEPGVKEVMDLCEQAYELTAPVLDYEEAATQYGWAVHPVTDRWCAPDASYADGTAKEYETLEELCAKERIDLYEWEVYEHWAVTQWFAEKLIAHGERVDTDFAGLNIWARTTTGQAISMDSVVQKIYREMTAA